MMKRKAWRLCVLFVFVVTSSAFATNYLTIDPNDYNFLIYDCGGDESSLIPAMEELDITNYTLRNASNPVTATDLASHDILIKGWSYNGYTGGLEPDILYDGITGRVILTAHDSDLHLVVNEDIEGIKRSLSQMINYVLTSSCGTGMIGMSEYLPFFSWTPSEWNISALFRRENDIVEITTEGIASGVYDGLTVEDMSGWDISYHNIFTSFSSKFIPFELGGINGDEVITIASVDDCDFAYKKSDNVSNDECRMPGNEITYTICWENIKDTTFENAYIVDYLPEGVEYDYVLEIFPSLVTDPNYSIEDHTYTWELGTVAPGDSGCVSLKVTVNEKAEPGVYLYNSSELWADTDWLVSEAGEHTQVCCWDTVDPDTIYVDKTATGNDTGVDWGNAYSGEEGLQRALIRASESVCDVGLYTVYVATGTYSPGYDALDSFNLPEGIKVYGGFMAGGSDISLRNPDMYETVLSADPNESYSHNDTVVTMMDDPLVDETTTLDGFTVTDAIEYGIYGDGVDFTIENCTVTGSKQFDGIYAKKCDVAIKWCEVSDNKRYGIYHYGNGTLTVENSLAATNKGSGIYTVVSTLTIKNSVVIGNGHDGYGWYGIGSLATSNVLYNNTIIYNAKEGYSGNPLDMQNCILWYNNDEGDQVRGFDQNTYASYCSIQGCDEVNNNINDVPGFMQTIDLDDIDGGINPYLYHLAYDSSCKDADNPNLDTGDVGLDDIDGEDRIYGSSVDRGADEIYSCDNDLSEDDIYNSLDFNFDGMVNYYEFAMFADEWLEGDPNYFGDPTNEDERNAWIKARKYNFNGDHEINLADLMYLAHDWAWIACWKQSQFDNMMMMGGGESMEMYPMEMGFAVLPDEPEPAPAPEPVERTTAEMVSFVKGIYDIIEYVDAVGETHENAENLYEIKTFLEGVLQDLQAER